MLTQATGDSFSQIKIVRESEGKSVITDYSVRYHDKYVRQDEKWLINARTGYFIIVETRLCMVRVDSGKIAQAWNS